MGFKKKALTVAMLCTLAVPSVASAQSFGIVEWSAEGVAMGGARMFAENDPTMLSANPAAITKMEKGGWAMGLTYISPHGSYDATANDLGKAYGYTDEYNEPNRIDAGIVPNSYYVQRIDEDEWWGIAAYTRFGMLSKFQEGSLAATNSLAANMQGLSIVPTYARKVNDKLSYAVSLEVNEIDLSLDSQNLVLGNTQLHDAKSYALGWNSAIDYEFDDKNEMAFVYRSEVTHSVNGKFEAAGGYAGLGKIVNADAYGVVTLPESYTIGYGHKFNDKTRLELQATYTGWSSYDKLNISVDTANGVLPINSVKDYSNGWRYAIGIEHKLSDKYSILGGYAYDRSVIPAATADFMIPTGALQTFSIGTQYHDEHQRVAVALGYMLVGDQTVYGEESSGDAFSVAHAKDSYTKIASIGYQRLF